MEIPLFVRVSSHDGVNPCFPPELLFLRIPSFNILAVQGRGNPFIRQPYYSGWSEPLIRQVDQGGGYVNTNLDLWIRQRKRPQTKFCPSE